MWTEEEMNISTLDSESFTILFYRVRMSHKEQEQSERNQCISGR
jgi:hypothetical protein